MNDWSETERVAIAERLKQARIAAGFPKAVDACRAFKWSYPAYSKHENGQRSILPKQALAYTSAFRVTLDYLYFGKVENAGEIAGNKDIVPLQVKALSPVSLMSVEVFEEMASDQAIVLASKSSHMRSYSAGEPGFFVETYDRSMAAAGNPRSIEPGAKVLVQLGEKPSPSNVVLALVRSEKAVMLRIYREVSRAPDGFVIYDLAPLNPDFRTIRVSRPDDAVILGTCEKVYQVQDLR
ncbi:MAG: hypothetical protein ACLP7P_08490 [Rhodomicrobium sp.]